MAKLLTRRGMDKILRRIMETGGMTEDMEKDVRRLRDDFDEREGELRRYGEVYDGEEDIDEYEYNGRVYEERIDSNDTSEIFTPREEEKDWKQEYEALKQRYLDAFTGRKDREEFEDIMEDTEEDVKRDGTPQTFDELLERTEG